MACTDNDGFKSGRTEGGGYLQMGLSWSQKAFGRTLGQGEDLWFKYEYDPADASKSKLLVSEKHFAGAFMVSIGNGDTNPNH